MADLAPDAPPGAHYAQEIARRVRTAMTERGLSQQELADAAGVGQRTVSRVLLGDVYCDVATLARLEQALRVSLYPADWFTREL
ncbi:helix-turn-helix transcriptional regulator [Nonomuraea sp. NPDC026600]|uniref:helix-turn-helix domain-containing protein n=1 Tax=Nonomuraea sp. NPDC026600 TaxID=3155363 RepID=UPI0033E51007